MSVLRNTLNSKFASSEDGGGTVFGLFIFVTLAMVMSLALDFTNAWRNRTYLSSTADIAAHAGAVAITEGKDLAAVEKTITEIVDFNMPSNIFGNVLIAESDITFADYNVEKQTFDSLSSANPNAVVVELALTNGRGNSLRSNLLQLVGIPMVEITAVSASVSDHGSKCSFSDGIFAKSSVTMTSQTDVGGGMCIHSEEAVWLPQQNTFSEDSMVSMPDLADCKSKCNDAANPGINPVEAHMVLGDFGQQLANTYDAFLSSMADSEIKSAFFTDDVNDPLDPVITLGDTSALAAMGYKDLAKGDVVKISLADFTSMKVIPSGLVYQVNCSPSGNGPKTIIEFSGSVAQMDGSVLLTNCTLDFASGSSVKSSVIVTTRESSTASLTADNNVSVGDPTPSANCDSTERAFIFSKSKVAVPAEFVLSNVTLVVDDDVKIASATSSNPTSFGFAIYATGEVQIAAQHTFRSCGDNYTGGISPEGKILRLVVPPAT